MDRSSFWKIIDDARANIGGIDEVGPAVTSALKELEPREIVAFKQHQYDLLSESYRWDLWAIGYIINGGCSDDGFDYFRAWLMANGSNRWKAALENPESIGNWAEPGDADYEDMLYVAVNAYENQTGRDFPYDQLSVKQQSEPIGEAWEEDTLPDLYPELYEKFA